MKMPQSSARVNSNSRTEVEEKTTRPPAHAEVITAVAVAAGVEAAEVAEVAASVLQAKA